ncbi:MAG: hypothetical protein JO257_05600 [Deltaproteobacteria bacterium]|nr:hypothetical protein [Deltaproteobacteria bacterium]
MDDLAAITRHIGWPAGRDVDLMPWLARLGAIAAERGAVQLAELTEATVRDPDSPDRLYELGYALIDAGAPQIAASVLWRCLALVGDSEEVVCELVSALESALAYRDAFAILEQHTALRARSFLCQYLYAFNAAMAGRLDTTRAALAELHADSPETERMTQVIAAIVERADRIAGPLGIHDLRGWQYVLSGTLVLHQSPYGYDDPMHGRYAWLQDGLPGIAFGLDRAASLVRGAPCVYAPEGRGHGIVATALARLLGVEVAPWPAVGVPAPGVVAVHDLAELAPGDAARLVERRPDQIVFAHAAPWTTDSPIAPELVTLLYQSLVPPWTDDRSDDELVDALVTGPRFDPDELAADEPARFASLVERAWPPQPGPRSRLWAGGPVPSNRFD